MFVSDCSKNKRISVFDADSGEFVRAFGETLLNQPIAVCVSHDKDTVFVRDNEFDRVMVFSSVGQLLCVLGKHLADSDGKAFPGKLVGGAGMCVTDFGHLYAVDKDSASVVVYRAPYQSPPTSTATGRLSDDKLSAALSDNSSRRMSECSIVSAVTSLCAMPVATAMHSDHKRLHDTRRVTSPPKPSVRLSDDVIAPHKATPTKVPIRHAKPQHRRSRRSTSEVEFEDDRRSVGSLSHTDSDSEPSVKASSNSKHRKSSDRKRRDDFSDRDDSASDDDRQRASRGRDSKPTDSQRIPARRSGSKERVKEYSRSPSKHRELSDASDSGSESDRAPKSRSHRRSRSERRKTDGDSDSDDYKRSTEVKQSAKATKVRRMSCERVLCC